MKKRTVINALPAIASAHLRLLPRLRVGERPYVAVLTADLHTDADPWRDRTDVLRRAFAGVTQKCGRVNAFVMAGDINNCGDEKEYRLLRRLTTRYLRADKIVPAMGNHDSWHHSDHPCFEIAYRLFRDFCVFCGHKGNENYYAFGDSRCNYIVLGAEKTMHNCTCISDRQLLWLEEQLESCRRQKKPLVVVNHQCLRNRNGGDGGWEEEGQAEVSDKIDALLQACAIKARGPVFFVSGHKHMLAKDCVERVSDNLLHLNLPSFEYGDGKTGAHPGAAAVLELPRGKAPRLYFYDFIKQEQLDLPI